MPHTGSDRDDGSCDLCPAEQPAGSDGSGISQKTMSPFAQHEVYIIAVVRLDFDKNDVAGLCGWCSRLDGPKESNIA